MASVPRGNALTRATQVRCARCPDESVDWDTTQHLMIEGDQPGSAEAAAKSYAGR